MFKTIYLFLYSDLTRIMMKKKKSSSEYSLEELQKQKRGLSSGIIGLGIGWVVLFIIMIFISKSNLLLTFIPLAIATAIPIYVSMDEINSEIKKRQEG